MAAFDGISYLNVCYHIVKFHYNLFFGMVTTVNQVNNIAKHHDSKKTQRKHKSSPVHMGYN